jgi:hypothetical protein
MVRRVAQKLVEAAVLAVLVEVKLLLGVILEAVEVQPGAQPQMAQCALFTRARLAVFHQLARGICNEFVHSS